MLINFELYLQINCLLPRRILRQLMACMRDSSEKPTVKRSDNEALRGLETDSPTLLKR